MHSIRSQGSQFGAIHKQSVIVSPKLISVKTEGLLFGCQILIFFVAGLLPSNFGKEESEAASYALPKIKDFAFGTISINLSAVIAVVGLLAIIRRGVRGAVLDGILEEAIGELPRILYVIGSGFAVAVGLAVTFMLRHPKYPLKASVSFTQTGLMVGALSFLSGLALKWYLSPNGKEKGGRTRKVFSRRLSSRDGR